MRVVVAFVLIFISFWAGGPALDVNAQSASNTNSAIGQASHLVYDIDDTFAFSTSFLSPSEETFSVRAAGTDYIIPKGFLEHIETVLTMDSPTWPIKISFYSASSEQRNQELLKAIKLRDGRSLFEISHKVLSSTSMVKVPTGHDKASEAQRLQPDNYLFRGSSKKDLRLIDEDLTRVLLIDDSAGNVMRGQESNFLFKYGLPDLDEGIKLRDDWVRITGIVTSAIRERVRGKPFGETLRKIQFDETGELKMTDRRYPQIGELVTGAKADGRIGCPESFKRLGR